MSGKFITVKEFSKSFGKTKVIHNLSFGVEKGEIFAFIGGNGQGKTTTIRALLGLLTPDSGELLIKGEKYSPERSSLLGYLPEERGLYTSSEVFETMIYFGEIKGMTKNDAKARAAEILDMVGLSDKKNSKIKKLSSGQQQKIQLAITIINSPELLILDEPTKGLDPVNRDLFMQLFLDMNRRGSTIIFSTHQMDEAEKVADRILMIKAGRRVLYGDLQDVKKQFGQTVQVNFSGDFPVNEQLYSARTENRFAELTLKEDTDPSTVLKYLIDKGLKIERFEVTTPSLNEIFIRVSNNDFPIPESS
jgi:ABC-2 type transport system ATP-binding protein